MTEYTVTAPTPDEHGYHELNGGDQSIYGYQTEGKGPCVHVLCGWQGELDIPADLARSVAAAMLAAADRADRLAAEAAAS